MEQIIAYLFSFLLIRPTFAQVPNLDITTTYNVVDQDAKDGDIVSVGEEENQLVRSKISDDEKIFGVITLSPLVVFRRPNLEIPIARTGEANVNVTSINGLIKSGDYITSSQIPGFGQKAGNPGGKILGIALSDFAEKGAVPMRVDGKEIQAGQVRINLLLTKEMFNLEPVKTSKSTMSPWQLIKYFIGAILCLITLAATSLKFGRNIVKGIRSLEKNPPSKRYIISMIIINFLFILFPTLAVFAAVWLLVK